ncbi:tRNA/rRNA methyltransferase (SpoU) [Candidatus Sulfotelmatobacter sp. SbA7]|nr:tRNA/rRNA methyltransferase (SpoU) [Candidatus Sulfotelmatobacter sp. SbA7]
MPLPTELDRLNIVLVSTRNPLNIGAAARAMSNFGFSHLRVVNPYGPAFREARSAVGAADILASAEQYKNLADAVADCTLVVATSAVGQRKVEHPLERLEQGARRIRKHLRSGRVAILFGSEKIGLTAKQMSHAHFLMRIPTFEKNISMNLGQAVAVCLYEIIRDAKAAKTQEKSTLASAEELERITLKLLEAMRSSGYLTRRPIADVEERMRRLVRRLKLPARDAIVWLGILRQIVWKQRKGVL